MGKRVTHSVETYQDRTFGLDKIKLRIACDDGSSYIAERTCDNPHWRMVERVDRDGSRNRTPSRLPATVKAHMDGRTGSGPYGVDRDEYWE